MTGPTVTRTADHSVDVTLGLRVPVLFPGGIDFPFTAHAHTRTPDESTRP
jgi:pilus assembly protein CpaE